MAFDFNVDEIFVVAEGIEKNGSDFYKRMSEEISDSAVSSMLLNLSEMEKAHEKVFSAMRKQLTDHERATTVFDPENETVLYLQAMAGLHVFDDTAGQDFVLSPELTGDAKIRKILRQAVEFEWKSISYYVGMKDFVPEHLGRNRIDEIIKEEMRHVTLLSRNLESLKKR